MRLLLKIAALAALVPVVYLSWTANYIWQSSQLDERPRSDAIVVLGAAQYDGTPSPVFRARLDHAKELYDEGVAPLIVVLGGKQQGDRFTEAQAGAAYLEAVLPADRVTGVKAGATTLDSLKKFTGMAQDRNLHSIVLVSDSLHLGRAREIAEDLGFEASVSASHIPTSVETDRNNLIRETVTLVVYRLLAVG
ncbi:MAG: YdcF family protein [Actinomycetota bacterium]